MDYGTVSEIPKENVRFLYKEYSKYPAYAHRGCLDKCKPIYGIWTMQAMDEFIERVKQFYEVAVLANVTHLNLPVSKLLMNLKLLMHSVFASVVHSSL